MTPKPKQQNDSDLAVTMANIEFIKTEMQEIKQNIKEIKSCMEADYVTQKEFDPIKKLVYGLVTLILCAVVTAIVGLVILK